MFAEILGECMFYMNEKEKQDFYRLCMENKYIKKRINETEKMMTFEERKKLEEKWRRNIKND